MDLDFDAIKIGGKYLVTVWVAESVPKAIIGTVRAVDDEQVWLTYDEPCLNAGAPISAFSWDVGVAHGFVREVPDAA